MPFTIVCVAPGASEAQVIDLANSIGRGWWALTHSQQRNQNGPGYSCSSCYNHFGTGRKVKAEPDPKQTAITQFFKKQTQ
jgi:hypothetical protein